MNKTNLIIDMKLKRPACVLIQAAGGGNMSTLNRHFDSECWLVAPTQDMRMVAGTDEEWARLARTLSKTSREERNA